MHPAFQLRRSTQGIVFVALIGAAQISSVDAQTVKFTPPKGAPAGGKQLTIAEALDGRVTIDFDEVPLDDAVDALKAAIGIEIQFSSNAIDESGVAVSDPVSFRIANVTLRSALKHMLAGRYPELTFMIQNEVLMILTREEVEEQGMIVRTYNVDDLLVRRKVKHDWIRQNNGYGSGANWSFAVSIDDLIEVIRFINPYAWDDRDGFGTIPEFDGLLVVQKSQQVHEQVKDLLRVLREIRDGKHAADGPGVTIASETCQAAERAILKALDRRETFRFANTPLRDVAEDFQQRFKIPILIDRKALDEVGVTPAAPVTFSGKNVAAKPALEQILEGIDPTITFAIDDDLLIITTREAAEEQLDYVAYPCGDLVLPETMDDGDCQVGPPSVQYADLDALIETISIVCSPDSWPEGTGPNLGMIEIEEPPVLIVEQTREVHEEIAELLASLRKARADRTQNGAQFEPAADEHTDDDKFQLVVYHHKTDSRAVESEDQPKTNPRKEHELVQLIKELIEPSSWSSKTAIRIVNDRLVVRHKKSAHTKIAELLRALGYYEYYFQGEGGLGF